MNEDQLYLKFMSNVDGLVFFSTKNGGVKGEGEENKEAPQPEQVPVNGTV